MIICVDDLCSNINIKMWSHIKEKGIKTPAITSKEIKKQLDPVLRSMEKEGIAVDVKKFRKLSEKLQQRVKILEGDIYRLAKGEFNIASPIQLSKILFEKLKLPTNKLKRTKQSFSTAASELRKIESDHKIIKPILEFRELTKLLSTYLKPLPVLVDKQGRLHTHYTQDTSTGRLTSEDPNLQNIPIKGKYGEEIRSAFVADKGKKLIVADYSQIELRVVACLSEDKAMLEAFNTNQDIHARTASELFNVNIKKITKDQRRLAKTVNFGVLYGMSPYGLSQALSIDLEEASKYIMRYFSVHSGVKDYCNEMIYRAKTEGDVETLFGFKRELVNINSPIRVASEADERIAINTPVQGTAAEIMKLAMIELDKKLPKSSKLILTVHDELVVEVPISQAKKIATLVKKTMEGVVTLCVPIKVDVGVGKNWADAK